MEPVVNKLQEGVKYPRFERDATKTINDLVEHITKERGVYSSSIEPNPSEHNIWFNTDNNTLMVYNSGAWRNFNVENSDKIKIITNPEKVEVSPDLTQYTINDNAFYIITDIDKYHIEIHNSSKYDFWLYIEKMPYGITFVDSQVITNLDKLSIDYTTLENLTMLAHKIGNVIEFTVISSQNTYLQKYYTTRNTISGIYVNTHEIISRKLINIKYIKGSNLKYGEVPQSMTDGSSEFPYDESIVVDGATVQLLYPPYHYPLDFADAFPNEYGTAMANIPKCLVINNLTSENMDGSNYKNPFSIKNSDTMFIENEDYQFNNPTKYATFPTTLVLNADVKFTNPQDKNAIIKLPTRCNMQFNHNLIIKKPSIFSGIRCDASIFPQPGIGFANLIIEDFGVSEIDILKYLPTFGAFSVKNVYLMGGDPRYILSNINNNEIAIFGALIYGSNFNNDILTFHNIMNVVIACKLDKDRFDADGSLNNLYYIYTLQENIDILKERGVNPKNGFIPITVNTVKDNDGFIVSESYGLTNYGINDFKRFEVPLVTY